MGRPERPLDPTQGPLASFAHDLRTVRHKAGTPSYRRLAAQAHYSATALSRAASGEALPSLEVTLAFVAACGGDTHAWEERWHAVRAELNGPAETAAETATDDAAVDVAGHAGSSPSSRSAPALARRLLAGHRLRPRVVLAAAVGIAVTAVTAMNLLPARSTARPTTSSAARTSTATVTGRDADGTGRTRPVRREGVLTLRANQIVDFDDRSWPISEASQGNPYDLEFTSDKRELDSIGNDDITVLPPGSHGTLAECGAQQNYSEPVTPALDRPGTLFCLITDTRRYVLCRIIAVTRDTSGRPVEVRMSAVIWEPRDAS